MVSEFSLSIISFIDSAFGVVSKKVITSSVEGMLYFYIFHLIYC